MWWCFCRKFHSLAHNITKAKTIQIVHLAISNVDKQWKATIFLRTIRDDHRRKYKMISMQKENGNFFFTTYKQNRLERIGFRLLFDDGHRLISPNGIQLVLKILRNTTHTHTHIWDRNQTKEINNPLISFARKQKTKNQTKIKSNWLFVFVLYNRQILFRSCHWSKLSRTSNEQSTTIDIEQTSNFQTISDCNYISVFSIEK